MNLKFSEMKLRKRVGMDDISRSFRGVFFLATLMIIIFGLAGAVPAAEGKSGDGSSVISDISMSDNSIQIMVQGPIKYSIQKPADPFTVIVELEGVSVGKFNAKIVSNTSGFTEIIPTQVETPARAARLTILLQSPSEVKAEVKDGTLMLSLAKTSDMPQPAIKGEPAARSRDGAAHFITDVAFDKDGDTLELIIKADGKLSEPTVLQVEGQVLLEIPGVAMKSSLPSKMPPTVRDIKVRTEQNRLKFTIALADKTNSEVYILDDEVVVDILTKEKKSAKPVAEKSTDAREKVATGSKLISLDFQDADIVPILRLLGDVGGYNMVIHPDVKGKITMKLLNVPWNQAMDIILKTFNLEKVVEGNIIRIATIKAFQDEKKAVAENKELFGKAEDIQTKVFTINSAHVDKVKDLIDKGKILSPRGTISVDARTRSVIVKDIQGSIDEVQRLLESLDRPTRQVLIEARIVEMSTTYSRALGVDWGFHARGSDLFGNKSGSFNTVGSQSASSIPGGNTQNASLINLPATTIAGGPATGAITFGFLNAAQTLGLDFRLSAVEENNKAKIISTPKILTLDNQEAVIKQGKRIPVTTIQAGGGGTAGTATFSTTYIDANLRLTVTPQIAPDGLIQLKLDITKDAPDFANKDNFGNPAIDTKQALTQVVLKDGETIVIGGIFTSNDQKNVSDIPGLGKIPLLGWLFKTEAVEKDSTELLIFVTPRIAQQ